MQPITEESDEKMIKINFLYCRNNYLCSGISN